MKPKSSHDKACKGMHLVNDDEATASCYLCGHTLPYSPVKVDIGAAHLLADIKGSGLRSVSWRTAILSHEAPGK